MENNNNNSTEEQAKGGFYTVNLAVNGRAIPYIVFATSDFQAAKKVKEETGYAAKQEDVEGPYLRHPF